MPSHAFSNHLLEVLQDADEILDAQIQLNAALLPPAAPGAIWGIGALNRAAVVMLVSAWEAYVEQVAIEAVEALRPASNVPLGNWPALYAAVKASAGQLHQPNVQNVRMLISSSIGLADITASWTWHGMTVPGACQMLERAVATRNRVAHGVNPRPPVPTAEPTDLQVFFQQLASRTDAGIRDYLVNNLGIVHPWPP